MVGLCLAPVVRADLLVTGQGESLSGELSRIASGIVVFRTSMRGQMMMPVDEVRALTTTGGDWAVTDRDGDVHIGQFTAEGLVVSGEGAKDGPIALSEVADARPLPAARAAGSADAGPRWQASAGIGVRAHDGVDGILAPEARVGLRGADSRGSLDLDLRFNPEDSGAFPEYFRGGLELSGAREAEWAPFVQALVERDRNLALTARTDLTVGVRYQFDRTDTHHLEAIAGFGGSYGVWDRDLIEARNVAVRDDRADRSDLNLHLELRYSRRIFGHADWDNRIYLRPSLTDADHFRAGASSSLRYPITDQLGLRLDMLLRYEPATVFEPIDSVDTSLGASIQFDF